MGSDRMLFFIFFSISSQVSWCSEQWRSESLFIIDLSPSPKLKICFPSEQQWLKGLRKLEMGKAFVFLWKNHKIMFCMMMSRRQIAAKRWEISLHARQQKKVFGQTSFSRFPSDDETGRKLTGKDLKIDGINQHH